MDKVQLFEWELMLKELCVVLNYAADNSEYGISTKLTES